MKKILVIDDNEIILTWFRDVLTTMGYDVTIASTAGQALTHLRTTTFDLAFFDHDLGDNMLNGAQIAAQLVNDNTYCIPKAVWVHSNNPNGAASIESHLKQSTSINCYVESYMSLKRKDFSIFKTIVKMLLEDL